MSHHLSRLAFAFLLQPSQGITAAVAANSIDYNAGIALYLLWWAILVLSKSIWSWHRVHDSVHMTLTADRVTRAPLLFLPFLFLSLLRSVAQNQCRVCIPFWLP